MGTFSSGASGSLQLSAVGTPAKTNHSGTSRVGLVSNDLSYSTADIVYSASFTATGVSDVATLDLQSGDGAQTTGTPTIADDGVDFEGTDLATAGTIFALLIEIEPAGANTVTVELENTGSPVAEALGDGENGGNCKTLMDFGSGIPAGDMTAVVNFSAVGDVVKITVVALAA